MFLPIFFVARQTQKTNMGQQPQRTAHPTHFCKRRGSTIIVSAKNNSFNVNLCCVLSNVHHARTHDTLLVSCCVEKCFFFSFTGEAPCHMLHKQHDDTCIATGTSILMLEVVFFLAASIQSGEHLRQQKAHHRDTQNATISTLTDEKPQTTSSFIQYGTQRRWKNTRARPTQTHTNVLTSWLHSSVNLGCCWHRHGQLSHHKSTSARVFLLWISRSKCIASPWSTCPKGICSASRWDAGHASACSQAIRAQKNT